MSRRQAKSYDRGSSLADARQVTWPLIGFGVLWRGDHRRRTAILAPLAAIVSLLVSMACSPARPLAELKATRESVSADGRGAPAPLLYSLSRPAAVDLYVVGSGGERYYLRRGEPRPAGQEYQYLFDGTYPLPDSPAERRVLPDGSYRLVLEAESVGQRQSAETLVAVRKQFLVTGSDF